MPVTFLSPELRESYGRFMGDPTHQDLVRYFYLDDRDLLLISQKRGHHNRLGFALQLGTVRYLGTFLDDPLAIPPLVLRDVAKQLYIDDTTCVDLYRDSDQRWQHAAEIRLRYGYTDITEYQIGFRLTRWLYDLCWTGTDRPTVLFERATTWLMAHKVLLPGCSTLERFISRLRHRVEVRLWNLLSTSITQEQQEKLERLLTVPLHSRSSTLDILRTAPVSVSSKSLVNTLQRLSSIREMQIKLPAKALIPTTRIAALARFASTAKVSAITRLSEPRRLATLVAFMHCLEATAQDDALEVLEALLREIFGGAVRADKKSRLRSLKDLDKSAAVLAIACQIVLDPNISDTTLRTALFAKIPRHTLELALNGVNELIRPEDNVYYQELENTYKTVRRFLPTLVKQIKFGANVTG